MSHSRERKADLHAHTHTLEVPQPQGLCAPACTLAPIAFPSTYSSLLLWPARIRNAAAAAGIGLTPGQENTVLCVVVAGRLVGELSQVGGTDAVVITQKGSVFGCVASTPTVPWLTTTSRLSHSQRNPRRTCTLLFLVDSLSKCYPAV